MFGLNNSFDYTVKLVGLLPLKFDFAKDENIGVRFHTNKLKKIKKPSEDDHDGQVIVSDEHLLCSSAIAEIKTIRHDTPTSSDDEEVSDEENEITSMANAFAQAVIAENDQWNESVESNKEAVVHDDDINRKPKVKKEDEDCKLEKSNSKSDKPVDKILEQEHSARFLYKSFYNTADKKPDFLSYRLPMIFLAIMTDPYFFKVNKIRFKPHNCEEEMEFIQIQWPILLDELYESSYDRFTPEGWSGPTFNRWATQESNSEKAGALEETTGNDTRGDNNDSDQDENSFCSYHRAYLQAEIKPKTERGSSIGTKEFNVFIAALVGGVWKLEEDPADYTCKHLCEMRSVKEETLRESRYGDQRFFYKRVRMLRNYWQCYLAGETNYLVGVNGFIGNDRKKRGVKELRLYDVSKIPDFIKKSGAEQGFRPWSKDILENRLYKSLCVIYDKLIDAPVGTEFMFIKYNEFDQPIHDVDGNITRPYLLAFRQVIIEGLPTPSQPKLVINLMKVVKYAETVQFLKKRKFTPKDIPEIEEKDNRLILTFEDKSLALLFQETVDTFLSYLKMNDKFPVGMENLAVKKVFMKKPVTPGGNNAQSWRTQQQHEPSPSSGNNAHSWRSSTQQSNSRHNDNDTRQADIAYGNRQSWRNSNYQQQQTRGGWRQFNAGNTQSRNSSHYQQQQQSNTRNANSDTFGDTLQSWRNSNNQQQQQHSLGRNNDNSKEQHYN